MQLPAAIHFLPKVYSEEQQSRFLVACDSWERALFSTFLFTGFREQEVMYLFWKDLNPKLRTVRVLSKPDLKFFPKRWEEREVPVPVELAELLESHPVTIDSPFVFPSPTGNREQNFLRRCKLIAERAGLDPEEFDLKTFRSTYATACFGGVSTYEPSSTGWGTSRWKRPCVIWRPHRMCMTGSI